MRRHLGTFAAALLMATSATSGAPAHAQPLPPDPLREALTCPSPLSTTPQVGLLVMCATVANAASVVLGDGKAGSAGALVRQVEPGHGPPGEESLTSLDLELPEPREGEDRYAIASGDGAVAVLSYPEGRLVSNLPGTGEYVATLPIGILAVDPAIAASPKVHPIGSPSLSTDGLTQTSAVCGTATSDGTAANSSGEAWYSACYRFYKPTANDTSPTYKWRQVFATGSAHGGNFNHHLLQTRNHVWLNDGEAIYDDWDPTGSTPYSACQTQTVTMAAGGPGFTVSASQQITVCPDSYGLQFFDPAGNPPKIQWGWDGNKGCGAGNCSYVGTAGGFSARVGQNQTFSAHTNVGITWGL